jgi:SAM-dependent methyltransferase
MRRNLLALICCPACQGKLEVVKGEEQDGEIFNGELQCRRCQELYPILRGMPLLYINDERWQPKAVEAEGWAAYHKQLHMYDVVEDSVDLKIPYYPEEPWIGVARSFDIALDLLELSGDETVLDLGAGRGWAAKEFALLGCRVVALDITPDENVGLGRARAIMKHHDVYFERVIGDGENLPFSPGSFDVIFCSAALHHSSNLPLLFKNASDVLKEGGRLCVIKEPCINVLADEDDILKRDAQQEMAVGINETRPDLPAYLDALTGAGMMPLRVFPSPAYQMSRRDLIQWARSLRAVNPGLNVAAFRSTLRAWLDFATIRAKALLRRKLFRAWRVTWPARGRERVEAGVLVWAGGDMILLAQRRESIRD